MGSSKKKSSFRIDDLLQHSSIANDINQHQHAQFKRQMFFAPVSTAHTSTANTSMESKAARNASGQTANGMPTTPHSFHRLMKDIMSSATPISTTSASTVPTAAPSLAAAATATSPIAQYADLAPHKPMPMYAPPPQQQPQPQPPPPPPNQHGPPPGLLDMSKQPPNYGFPMPMAMHPQFSHAATAYLEHYANTFHKGKCNV